MGGRKPGLNKDAESKAIVADTLYKEGELSVQKIADQLNISKTTLYKYLRHRGVEISNMIILYNVVTMTKVIGKLAEEGYPIGPEVSASTSPFRRGNINRFGTYSLNMERDVPNIEFEIPFAMPNKNSDLVVN